MTALAVPQESCSSPPPSSASVSRQVSVGISDAAVSADPSVVLVTHSLGSCIGIACHDPAKRVSGLLHFQLPESTMDPARAAQTPLMFCDTGLDWLLAEMRRQGASTSRLQVRLAGGAKMLAASAFDIGRRNHAAARKQLWKHGLLVAAEHCGGTVARTLYLRGADGAVRLRAGGQVIEL